MGSSGKGKAVAYRNTDQAIGLGNDANAVPIWYIPTSLPFSVWEWVGNNTDAQTTRINTYQSDYYLFLSTCRLLNGRKQ